MCSSIPLLEFREWCRNNLSSYYEVFIEAPLDHLLNDVKGIYARHLRGEIKNVAGLDLDFPGPINSDLIISNSGSKEAFLDFLLFRLLLIKYAWNESMPVSGNYAHCGHDYCSRISFHLCTR